MGRGAKVNIPEIYFMIVGSLDTIMDISVYKQYLSNDENERASRFKFDDDRNIFILAHGNLRKLIGMRLMQNPACIQFTLNSYGKPILPSNNLHFNITHTRNAFAIALSEESPIGIDIENFKRTIEWEPIANSYFSKPEKEWIIKHQLVARQKAFYEIWTRKEALLKAIGIGMIDNLQELNVLGNTFDSSIIDLPSYNQYNSTKWGIKSYSFNEYIISIAYLKDISNNIYLKQITCDSLN